MKKRNVETLTETESRRAAGGGGGDRLRYEIVSTQLWGLGLRRGDVVEVKRRTEIKLERLMAYEINGVLVFGRAYPHDCARLRVQWSSGGHGLIGPEHDLKPLGIPVLSTRVSAREAKEKWGLPKTPRRRKGAK